VVMCLLLPTSSYIILYSNSWKAGHCASYFHRTTGWCL